MLSVQFSSISAFQTLGKLWDKSQEQYFPNFCAAILYINDATLTESSIVRYEQDWKE